MVNNWKLKIREPAMINSHFFAVPTQGNIYTMTLLKTAKGPMKLLVASLKRDIYCIEYQESDNILPTAKEVSFTYIPGTAEIIAIDAFNKSLSKNEFVIGITIVKNRNTSDSLEFYLNIYSEWEESEDFNIENIAQNCLTLELNFNPLQLTHTDLVIWDQNQIVKKEVIFLLSGGDNQIHIYREHSSDHLYKEFDGHEYFPEFFRPIPSRIIWIDIYYNKDNSLRYSAIGCECGFIRFSKFNVKTNDLQFSLTTKLNNLITSVKIYESNNARNIPDLPEQPSENIPVFNKDEENINLIAVCSVLPAIIYEDILIYGLSNYSILPRIDNYLVQTCCEIEDVDFDGQKEILIGNSGEEIVLYKHNKNDGWHLDEIKQFASPIFNFKYADLIGDGVKELIVFSMKGVHFLQYDSDFIQTTLQEKVDMMLATSDLKRLNLDTIQED